MLDSSRYHSAYLFNMIASEANRSTNGGNNSAGESFLDRPTRDETTITHPIYGRIEYETGKDKVSVQRGDLAERIKWMLRPENERLLGHGIGRDQFIEACAVLGILFGAKSIKIKKTSQEESGVKTIIESSIYGRITHDDETDRVTVQRGQLAERISWLLKPENDRLLGHGYWPSRFCRVCEVLGLMQDHPKITTSGERPLPPGAVY